MFWTGVVGRVSHRMPQKSKSMRKRGAVCCQAPQLPVVISYHPPASSSCSSLDYIHLSLSLQILSTPLTPLSPFLFLLPAGSDPFMSFISTFSLRFRLCGFRISSFSSTLHPRRQFHSSQLTMSNSIIQLTAPNGRKYAQPIGLFINNEFVPSKSGDQFATVNPRYRSS